MTVAAPNAVLAQADSPEARALFSEGRRLMKAGQYEFACPKFEAARALFSGSGVLLNLGDCYEKSGRFASAWMAFRDAGAAAHQSHREGDEAEAARRETALEARVSKLVVHVTQPTEGLTLQAEALSFDTVALKNPIPLDSGRYRLRAQAPGHLAWESTIDLPNDGRSIEVTIPVLPEISPVVDVPSPTATPPPLQPQSAGISKWRTVGIGTAATGIIGVGIGTAFGLMANSDWSSAKNECNATACPNHTQAVADHDSSTNKASVSTIAFVSGAALIAAGVALYFIAPKFEHNSSEQAISVAPSLADRGGGVTVVGAF